MRHLLNPWEITFFKHPDLIVINWIGHLGTPCFMTVHPVPAPTSTNAELSNGKSEDGSSHSLQTLLLNAMLYVIL